jgi:hypothetical protein
VEKARAVFDELEARSRHEFVSPFWIAAVAAAAGRGEDARRYAKRSVIERESIVVLARILPQWDGVRAMPWFEDVVRGVWG